MIYYNRDTFDALAVQAIQARFPLAVVTDQKFNHFYTLEFPDGTYGVGGMVNGPLEVDIYDDEMRYDEGFQPNYSVKISEVYYDGGK